MCWRLAHPDWQLPGWAHHSGALAMGGGVAGADPDAARLVIERVARYCWAYDERRADLLADCFTEDGVWEGNVLDKVPVGPFIGRAKILKWLTEFWPHQHDQRRHMLLNNLVESLYRGQRGNAQLSAADVERWGGPKVECTGFYRCELIPRGRHLADRADDRRFRCAVLAGAA